jgi:hypothetical protein
MSPPTRDQSHAAGRGRVRMPAPAPISRMPTVRITVDLGPRMPIARPNRFGAISCAAPSPMLNQPRNLATRSASGRRDMRRDHCLGRLLPFVDGYVLCVKAIVLLEVLQESRSP